MPFSKPFGAILLQRVEDLRIGYQQITKYIQDVKLHPEYMNDFVYRNNKPRESTTNITDLKINRLTTWSVRSFFEIQDVLLPDTGLIQHFQSPKNFACCLELDINTAREYQGEFDKEQLFKILMDLAELGKEIAQKGDVL